MFSVIKIEYICYNLNIMRTKLFIFFLVFFPFFHISYAQNKIEKLNNPLGNNINDIPSLVKAILDIVLNIGVPIIALAIIYAGYKFVAAQGKPEKLKEAKQTILYVFIGAAILLAAYAIAQAIFSTVTSIRE